MKKILILFSSFIFLFGCSQPVKKEPQKIEKIEVETIDPNSVERTEIGNTYIISDTKEEIEMIKKQKEKELKSDLKSDGEIYWHLGEIISSKEPKNIVLVDEIDKIEIILFKNKNNEVRYSLEILDKNGKPFQLKRKK